MAAKKKPARKTIRKPQAIKAARPAAMWFVLDARGKPVFGIRADRRDAESAALRYLGNPSPYPKLGFRAACVKRLRSSPSVSATTAPTLSIAKGK